MSKTKKVSINELLEAMQHLSDETPFRYYQTSIPGPFGWAIATDTLYITIGDLRKLIK